MQVDYREAGHSILSVLEYSTLDRARAGAAPRRAGKKENIKRERQSPERHTLWGRHTLRIIYNIREFFLSLSPTSILLKKPKKKARKL